MFFESKGVPTGAIPFEGPIHFYVVVDQMGVICTYRGLQIVSFGLRPTSKHILEFEEVYLVPGRNWIEATSNSKGWAVPSYFMSPIRRTSPNSLSGVTVLRSPI